jgi:hypothetical protein
LISVHYNRSVKSGDLVRIVKSAGGGKTFACVAFVLTVSSHLPELLGGDGEPTLTVAFLNPQADPSTLTGANWTSAFERVAGVAHYTHAEAIAGKRGIYWVDNLPAEVSAADLEIDELPEIPSGTSAVFSRETADRFFEQPSRTVPSMVEPVREDNKKSERRVHDFTAGTDPRMQGEAGDSDDTQLPSQDELKQKQDALLAAEAGKGHDPLHVPADRENAESVMQARQAWEKERTAVNPPGNHLGGGPQLVPDTEPQQRTDIPSQPDMSAAAAPTLADMESQPSGAGEPTTASADPQEVQAPATTGV